MAPRTPSCELPSPQPSASGERLKSPLQQPGPSSSKKQLNGKERQCPRTPATPASPRSQRSRSAPVDQNSIRWAKHQGRYQKFLAEAEQRRLKRKELETRNKMWQKEKDKSQARLQAVEEERRQLLQKMNAMNAAITNYNINNAVGISKEMDQATHAKWTAYFNLETDELEV